MNFIKYIKNIFNFNQFDKIKIEVIPKKVENAYFFYFINKSNKPVHIFFNNEAEEINKCYIKSEDNASKIKIILDKNIKSFFELFKGCTGVKIINFISFNRKNITNMINMFFDCINLKQINLSNFITDNVNNIENMNYMFYNCSNLTSLILSNFDTTSVYDMSYMFSYCESLTQLDLSSFNISSLNSISYMFNGCKNLEYINLNNSIEKNNLNTLNLFDLNPINIVVCTNINNTKIIESLKKLKCYLIDCSDDWKKKQKKIIFGTEECLTSCNETKNNKYEHENICYETCPNGTYYINNYTNYYD